MRNPQRIPEVMVAIGELWSQCPDLRFYQFISVLQSAINARNGQPYDSDLFYMEDDRLLRSINKIKDSFGSKR